MYRQQAVALVIAVAGLAAACGDGADRVQSVGQQPEGTAQPTPANPEEKDRRGPPVSIPNPAPDDEIEPPTPPVSPDPQEELLTNPNDPSSPLGALCWSRWEVARNQLLMVLVDGGVLKDKELPPTDHPGQGRLEQALARVATAPAREAAVGETGVPAHVRPFAEAFFNNVDEAIDTGPLAAPVDFENLPGAAAYVQAATKEPDCVRP